MKQMVFMITLTALGTIGTYLLNPIYGVMVYYIFAVLRPPELWEWALPKGIAWSYYVGMATLGAAVLSAIGGLPDTRPPAPTRPLFSRGHFVMFAFAIWIAVTTYLALNFDQAEKWFMEYLKIFLMFGASAVLIKTVHEVRLLMVCVAITLAYLAFEINLDYLQTGWLRVYFYGHGGMDNNGAGLLLAMSIPIFYFLFEGIQSRWRYLMLLAIPPAVHAVQMTFSRGAMLSLIIGIPLIVMRSRHRKRLILALILLGPPLIYVTAGPEIQKRFFSIESASEVDDSAKSRLMSWQAALRIAREYPVFGVGVRNSNLISKDYGADMEGRTIHSTYLQLAADNGFTGLGLYLLLLLTVWREVSFVRHQTRGRDDPELRLYHSLACAVESSLAIFCFGTLFLSLETFELPYFLMLCAIQSALLYRYRRGPIYDPVRFIQLTPPPEKRSSSHPNADRGELIAPRSGLYFR